MLNKSQFLILILLSGAVNVSSQVLSEFRGIRRTGVYNESNLLKQWPREGPRMLWQIESLPKGNSSVSIAHGMIFTTGIKDDKDILIAMDMKGGIIWETPYGRAWTDSYSESRCTPTIDGDLIYVSSGYGDLACVDAHSGKIKWSRKASEELQGVYGRWGLAESLLISGNKVFFTPGGGKTTTIALDKTNGQTVWLSESLNDEPSYTSPIIVNRGGKDILINVTLKYIFGIWTDNGKILWRFDFASYLDRGSININTPLYYDGYLFVTSGYNHKSVMLKLSDDGLSVSRVWVDEVLDVHHGGVVKVDNFIYGSNWLHNTMGKWVCLDWKTGKVMYEKEWINKGSIIAAEGMLYCYEEKTGNIALVKASPEDFTVISSFKINKGSGPHWSHPVIKDGILYVRHGEALMAYSIKSK